MRMNEVDIDALLSGEPPVSPEVLTAMTLGRDQWLDWLRDHYLANYRIHLGSFHREMARRLIISLIKQRLIFARAWSKVHSKFGVAESGYESVKLDI